jgi:hypothetical protein
MMKDIYLNGMNKDVAATLLYLTTWTYTIKMLQLCCSSTAINKRDEILSWF